MGSKKAEDEVEKHNTAGSLSWSGAVQREVLCQAAGRAVVLDNAGAEGDLESLVAGLVPMPAAL